MRIGFFLSTEEHTVRELVDQAALAEQAGFEALWVSDHFHPWNDEQGQSPFVWSLIGALSQVTQLPVTTAVTCPIMRTGPAIVAQAAATCAAMLPGGFQLGVGTGEALNEHITGQAWPPAPVRLKMLQEAVAVIRELWTGADVTHRGEHFTVENARLYTLPDSPPPILMSAFGPRAAEVAARISDGLQTTSVDEQVLSTFREKAPGKPVAGGVKVCYADTEDEGVDIAHRLWPNAGLPGELAQVLPTVQHFEQASQLVTRESSRKGAACGPDPARHLESFEPYLQAGFDEVYVGNMGPHYKQMFELYHHEVLPALRAR